MKAKHLNKWEKIRAKGRKKYIIINGVVAWGIPTAILFAIVMTLWNTKTIEFNRDFIVLLLTSIILFPIGGIGVGVWTWHTYESNYQKNRNNRS
ncbi:hypothetical protein M3201_03540 [Paenibacillus motobuensis]|uniref:hypothetical protein n=1 Tax=Paenibacillus TaxID=44249 RepID=UPI002040B69C|nr:MULTISPECIES: hypothetical protein [Paenibacillus]MCM3038773.1 hypothetical protein [Paenibacillus lutimineralis]MCM3645877.1 hypothetical protein [Paenibacillus motobuensis]